eukprot:CAMPEP_0181207778 /NCGR_PEP_ID=MMETSP1096-20121128/21769_1 /TAXON_ID=156174 ORGANISM="Chrysochromulina ericina, Strain CCMP281" /NCGR_SAMPLE_ID=MMETSP1096 /ASSEMBLY_ACC=CAM_ASM_000453 /LENGTH=58 /DNA_ID=CAMNT_0023298805 /DNA_START=311 /DNA_END=488 /DNA_ORIENTATION=+
MTKLDSAAGISKIPGPRASMLADVLQQVEPSAGKDGWREGGRDGEKKGTLEDGGQAQG